MAASLLDIITSEEAAASLNQEGGASAVTLQSEATAQLITAVSAKIDALTGPVVIRTVTAEEHDGSTGVILLNQFPVVSVTTVTEWSGQASQALVAENRAAPTENDYSVVLAYGALYRRSGGGDGWWPYGRANILVTYTAGRFATTATVSPQFKTAASMLFRHWWTASHGVGSRFGDVADNPGILATGVPSFDVPNSVVGLLSDQIRMLV